MPIAMIFTVVVIALIIVGGIFFGKQLLGGGNLTNAEQEEAQIVSGIQSMYAQQQGFGTVTTAVVAKAGIAPANDVNAGAGTISNPYGGSVTVNPDSTYQNAFDVSFTGLGNSACSKLATGVSAFAENINGTNVSSNNTAVDPATATNDCSAGSGANSVTFVNTQSNG